MIDGMRTTIDRAGRVVIPKALREEVGMWSGDVEIVVDGSGLRIEPVTTDDLDRQSGRAVIPASGNRLSDDHIRALRYADQR